MSVVPNISQKLLTLLNSNDFKDSSVVIELFKNNFSSDWKTLLLKYGGSSDKPGTGSRKKFYSAEVYLCDRLSGLHQTGKVEREFIKNSNYKSAIGNWRLITAPVIDPKLLVSARIPKSIIDQLTKIASDKNITVSSYILEIIESHLNR